MSWVGDEGWARGLADLAAGLDMPAGLLDGIAVVTAEDLERERAALQALAWRRVADAVEVVESTYLRPALIAAGLDPDRYRLVYEPGESAAGRRR